MTFDRMVYYGYMINDDLPGAIAYVKWMRCNSLQYPFGADSGKATSTATARIFCLEKVESGIDLTSQFPIF